MSDVPVQLLVAAFTEEDAADKVFEQLKQAKKEKLIHIQDVAVIKRDADSKIHITSRRTGRRARALVWARSSARRWASSPGRASC